MSRLEKKNITKIVIIIMITAATASVSLVEPCNTLLSCLVVYLWWSSWLCTSGGGFGCVPLVEFLVVYLWWRFWVCTSGRVLGCLPLVKSLVV